MYVAVLTSILGEALWFHSRAVLLYAAVAAVCFHLMIVLYEEPRLARDFGTTYAAYRASVPRWLLPLRRRTGG
jgi:protein-S-isoprenylcysteine O-methyltransferase Ste14